MATSFVMPDTPEVAAAAELAARSFAEESLTDMKPVAESTAAEAEPKPFVVASLGDPTQILPPETAVRADGYGRHG